jgi:cyclophilin family peptidyl-prolyl cis-trans isomerase
LAGCGKSEKSAAPAAAPTPPPAPVYAVIETEKGIVEFELLTGDAPKTTENFRLLAERGYYNGLTFHRIVKDFMIQGGDPLGDGRGGESAWGGKFDDEIVKNSPLYQNGLGYKRGIVAMANAGPNTNASQFFILHKDYPLAPSYTIFGRVTKGIEVIDATRRSAHDLRDGRQEQAGHAAGDEESLDQEVARAAPKETPSRSAPITVVSTRT